MKPFVTVIVPSKRWTSDCEECLESLRKQDYPHDSYEVIFVTDEGTEPQGGINGSKPNDAIDAAETGPRVRVVRTRVPGISGARNHGASLAEGEYLAFTDSDGLTSPDWLTKITRCAIVHRSALVVGRVVTDFARYLSPIRTSAVNLKSDPLRANACNLLCKKSVFTSLEGFSLDFAYTEDYDLGVRAVERGYTVSFCSEGVVSHKLDSYDLKGLWRLSKRSQYYALLYKRHPKWTRRYLRMVGPFSLQSFTAGAVLVSAVLGLVGSAMPGYGFAWFLPLVAFIAYSSAYSIVVLPHETPRRLGSILLGSFAMLVFSMFAFLWKVRGSHRFRTLMF